MGIKLKVREVAESHGIDDAAKLSRASGVAYATAHRIWRNEIGKPGTEDKGPGIFVLHKIAQALGVRVSDLLDEDWLARLVAAGSSDTTNRAVAEALV